MLGEQEVQLSQSCGGHINATTLRPSPYLTASGGTGVLKGFICPLGQLCKQSANPDSNTESFDNIYSAALQVMIVASANGVRVCFRHCSTRLTRSQWAPLMYSIIDAEYFFSCMFFIIAVLVLNFWLINLFVAVITHTFSAIRDGGTRRSAFGAALCVFSPVQDNTALNDFQTASQAI
jgi:hypothetical protein